MLTKSELESCQNTEDKHRILPPVAISNPSLEMCRGTSGLLSKLVALAKKSLAPVYRFLLHRAIESFLRGKTSYPYQVLIRSDGLIENTVDKILLLDDIGLPSRNSGASISDEDESLSVITTQVGNCYEDIIQCSFDLLAQLVKFNVESLQKLSDRLLFPHPSDEAMDTNILADTFATTPELISPAPHPWDRSFSFPPWQSSASDSGFSESFSVDNSSDSQRNQLTSLQKFINIIFDNIIDSNMFVR